MRDRSGSLAEAPRLVALLDERHRASQAALFILRQQVDALVVELLVALRSGRQDGL